MKGTPSQQVSLCVCFSVTGNITFFILAWTPVNIFVLPHQLCKVEVFIYFP